MSTLEVQHIETLQESVDRLRDEVEDLRASRERLVLACDADRRDIERSLHEGVQQQLIALAVNLQLAGSRADDDPAIARASLDDLGRDVQQALDEAAQLAEQIYPPLLETGGLATALRTAALKAGSSVSVDVTPGVRYPPEVARTVYLCCLEAFSRAGKVTVRGDEETLTFKITDAADGLIDGLSDRVEALGGGVTLTSQPDGGVRVTGSLPVSR